MKYSFRDIVGLDKVKGKCESEGITITPVDESIAEAIYNLTEKNVRKYREDSSGVTVEKPIAYIRDSQVEQLIKSFPNAAAYIYAMNRDDNFGFEDKTNGTVYRTGVMGEYDPIAATRGMVAAYVGTKYERGHLFDTLEQEQEWERKTISENGRDPFNSISAYGVSPDDYYASKNGISIKAIVANAMEKGVTRDDVKSADQNRSYKDKSSDLNR